MKHFVHFVSLSIFQLMDSAINFASIHHNLALVKIFELKTNTLTVKHV